MDREEAKQVLQALRPNDLDVTQPAFAEALTLAEQDPELKAWWEAQQAFDRKVAAKLHGVPVPADLRANILAGHKIVEPFAFRPMFPVWLAAAAAVAIVCAISASFHTTYLASQHISTDDYEVATLNLIHNDAPDLAILTTDHDKILEWLRYASAPMGTMPGKMQSLPTIGCQKFVVQGHDVSLICFTLPNGREAHLFMVAKDALTEPPGTDSPDIKMVHGWATAEWSDDRMSYLLATQDNMDALRQLL